MAVAYDNIIYNSVMDEIERVLIDVRDEIRAKMANEGVNASGRTSAGMQVQRYENGVRLVLTGDDVAPLATLEVGRRGGKVPMGFTDIIEQWSRDKGLTFPRERDRRSFAYLTARKIARQGTQRHQQPIDIYSEEVTRGVERLKDGIKAQITEYIHNSLINI
jgi:hypothetical protein